MRWRRCHKRLEVGYSSRVGQVRESSRRIPTAETKVKETTSTRNTGKREEGKTSHQDKIRNENHRKGE